MWKKIHSNDSQSTSDLDDVTELPLERTARVKGHVDTVMTHSKDFNNEM